MKSSIFVLFIFFLGSDIFSDPSNSANIEFVKIPQGEFTFDNSYFFKFNKGVRHSGDFINVKISAFFISRSPVKRIQWEKLLGVEKFPPWSQYSEKCPECPAENLLFKDVMFFLDELSKKDFGKKGFYRLPTEAELIYILSQCGKDICGNLKSFGSQMEIHLKKKYQNKFDFQTNFNLPFDDEYSGEISRQKNKLIYFFTEDYPSNSFLGTLIENKSTYSDPRPKSDERFNYGRTLLSFYKLENKIQINRSGHSINMFPENSKVFFYIVRK